MHWYIDVLKKYAVFEGRATRSEYWMFFLFNFVISIAVGIVAGIIGIKALGTLYSVALFIPSIAVLIRRLHDTDKSGWWALLILIPIIGWIILIVFLASESQSVSNQYGPNSKPVNSLTTEPVTTPAPVEGESSKKEEEVVINDIPESKRTSLEERLN